MVPANNKVFCSDPILDQPSNKCVFFFWRNRGGGGPHLEALFKKNKGSNYSYNEKSKQVFDTLWRPIPKTKWTELHKNLVYGDIPRTVVRWF